MSSITVKTAHGDRTLPTLWQKNGLAVHRSSRGYAISHVGTGYAVVRHGLEPQQAILLATKLLAIADWTNLTKEQLIEPQFYHTVWQVIGQGREQGVSGFTPEQWRLALYASDFDENVMKRLAGDA